MPIKITVPFERFSNVLASLKAGDNVLISGTIYTARDAAHQRIIDTVKNKSTLSFPIKNQIIYYVGPCPAPPNFVTGSAGPTTSARIDKFTPPLLNLGLKGMIGKGFRSKEVIESMIKNGAVYFGAIGGAGALIAETIKTCKVVAFDDLGAEAVYKLLVEDFPATVLIDSKGNNLYDIGPKQYLKTAAFPK